MLLIIFIAVTIIFLYSLLIYAYSRGFEKYPSFTPSSQYPSHISATILIPCRNPSEQLHILFQQLKHQLSDNHTCEILVIDDFSNNEINMEAHENCKLVQLKNHQPQLSQNKNNKKEAIALGVSLASYEYIICLDSDVSLSENWWLVISNFIDDKKPKFVAGLHRYKKENHWLNDFLVLEQDILTASSIAALQLRIPTMCNGANMLFSKQAFVEVNGYDRLYHTNGGDDLFLYHRIYQKFPYDTYYIKNIKGAVYSEAPKTIAELLRQRSRWISKTTHYENYWVNVQGGIILATSVLSIVSIPFLPLVIMIKVLSDVFYARKINRYYGNQCTILNLIVQSLCYPFYVLTVIFYRLRKG